MDFVKPELLVLVPVLVFIGKAIKESARIDDSLIPLILGVLGILLSSSWVFAASPAEIWQNKLMAIFVSVVQGILCASMSVYGNQVYKQNNKRGSSTRYKL